jgi:hypothetical protein
MNPISTGSSNEPGGGEENVRLAREKGQCLPEDITFCELYAGSTPHLIVIILLVCNKPRVMGQHLNGKLMNILGIIAAIVMSGAALAMLIVQTSSW